MTVSSQPDQSTSPDLFLIFIPLQQIILYHLQG